jgi:arsenate reductase
MTDKETEKKKKKREDGEEKKVGEERKVAEGEGEGEGEREVRIEVLVFEGCPHVSQALEMARDVATRLGPDVSVRRVDVDTEEKAEELDFRGSPTLRVAGEDVELADKERRDVGALREKPVGLGCRTYEGGAGVPPRWMVEAAVLRALQPKGLLFMCVANAARSQMAEGIARSLAPPHIKIWSAGSMPAGVRPEAIAVLDEIGIDISGQRSKDVSEVPAMEVDTAITLCSEEECPLFIGEARRLDWPMYDPVRALGQEARIRAFRAARDELRRRIGAIFR